MVRERERRVALVLALAALLLPAQACLEEVSVRVDTQVFPDGGLERVAVLEGREPERDEPYPTDWLALGPGLALAEPDAWDRVESAPTVVRAEGYFAPGERVPPVLRHRAEGSADRGRADRALLQVSREDLVVLHRVTFEEAVGDPYGPAELGAALDSLLAALAEGLRDALRAQFGPEVVTAPAEAYLLRRAKGALLDVLAALRETEPAGRRAGRPSRLSKVLTRHGLGPAPDDEDAGHVLMDVATRLVDEVARQVVAANPRLPSEPLRRSVTGDGGAVARLLGTGSEPPSDPRIAAAEQTLVASLTGDYGQPGGPRVRFVHRLRMPGRVLRANGTVDGDAVVWSFGEDAVASRDVLLSAEAVELDREALTRLGARRELDAAALLHVVELLTRADAGEPLRAALAEAVRTGGFRSLREGLDDGSGEVPRLGRELADLLDPASPPWPAR